MEYAIEKFKLHGIDTAKKLQNLRVCEYDQLGVKDENDRKKLFALVTKIRKVVAAETKSKEEEEEKVEDVTKSPEVDESKVSTPVVVTKVPENETETKVETTPSVKSENETIVTPDEHDVTSSNDPPSTSSMNHYVVNEKKVSSPTVPVDVVTARQRGLQRLRLALGKKRPSRSSPSSSKKSSTRRPTSSTNPPVKVVSSKSPVKPANLDSVLQHIKAKIGGVSTTSTTATTPTPSTSPTPPVSSKTNINNKTNENTTKIRVCVRKRPMSQKEREHKEFDVADTMSTKKIRVHEPRTKVDLTQYVVTHDFMFDEVFDESVSTSEIYEKTARELVGSIFRGGKATCFAYGQTGSGKTYTMLGPDEEDVKHPGLYVTSIIYIYHFEHINTPSQVRTCRTRHFRTVSILRVLSSTSLHFLF